MALDHLHCSHGHDLSLLSSCTTITNSKLLGTSFCSTLPSLHQAIRYTLASPHGLPQISDLGRFQNHLRCSELAFNASPVEEGAFTVRQSTQFYARLCTSISSLTEAKRLHDHLVSKELLPNIFLENTLINMYVRCGSMVDARQVFENMPEGNVFSWTLIIAGCVKHGYAEEALEHFWQMEREGINPDNVTFVSILKACTSMTSLDQGKTIHAQMIKCGIKPNIFLWNAMVDMYAKCGSIVDASQVFDNMHERDVISWNAMISGCVQCGLYKKAFELFQQMEAAHLKPDEVTFVSILKSCCSLMAVEEGKEIHTRIIESGYESNNFIGSTLIDFYAKCGCIDDAGQMFHKMVKRDVVSWNAMIAGYAKKGYWEDAFDVFRRMQEEGVKPDKVTFMCILDACVSPMSLEQGKQVHAYIIGFGQESNVFVGNSLIDMYSKCNRLEDAVQIFVKMPTRNVVSWNTMITGYSQTGHSEDAVKLVGLMQKEHVKPNEVTFVGGLHACANLGAVEQGKLIHVQIIEVGHDSSIQVGNTLIDMYGKSGSIQDARKVFDSMLEQDVVSWNAMITVYVLHEHHEDAIKLLQQMQQEGFKPNEATFINIISACASIASLEQCKLVHADAIRAGHEMDICVGSAIIDMYSKCATIHDAQEVFNRMPQRGIVAWNAIITGHVKNGHAEEALWLHTYMQQEGVMPDEFTFVSILNACGSLSALNEGRSIHNQVIKAGHDLDIFVASALIDMYVKCGRVEYARQFFDEMLKHDVISWTAMIAGYAQHGDHLEVFALFEQMKQEGVKPDGATFLCVLLTCSHAGLVDEGLCFFYSMTQEYGIIPTAEHLTCMVDLFGRSGCLGEAENFINKMPLQHGAVAWRALLGACRNHGNVEMAERASQRLLELEPKDSAAYVLLSNTYAAANRWDNLANIRNNG